MGTLLYGAAQNTLRVDDLVLAHLQTVITTKLRRSEGLLLTWDHAMEDGPVRGAAWIHPHCDISYRYDGDGDVPLDSEMLDRMMAESSGTRGLRVPVSAEPDPTGIGALTHAVEHGVEHGADGSAR